MDLKFTISLFLVALIAFTSATDNKTESPTDPPDVVTPTEPAKIEPSTTSSTSTTTTATTTTSTTTTEKPTPPPTTAAPITTTPAPAPITTAAPPTPTPIPEMGKWSFTKENQTCLIVQMAVQLNISYVTKDGNNKSALYNVPSKDTTLEGGDCGNLTNKIQLKWANDNHIALDFNLNQTTSRFYLSAMAFKINTSDLFSDAKANQEILLYHLGSDFSTPIDMSYHCTRQQTLNLTRNHEENSTAIGFVYVSKVQFEAFHHNKGDSFSTAKDCDAIDTPDIVPIAVGCALAALVVVVLIAYLVARRRSQARGYLSM